MIELNTRKTWLTYDLQQFAKNLAYVKQTSHGKILWPAVKADCYQHGLQGLFSTFISQEINHFCVAYYDEAVYLQQLADELQADIEILIFGDVPIEYLNELKSNWSITVAHEVYAKQILATTITKPLNIQIKIDSGMNRRGFKSKTMFQTMFEALEVNMNINIIGIYTHFATADNDPNASFMYEQVKRFNDVAATFFSKVRYVHAQNSHGLVNLPLEDTKHFNSARPGAICYGLSVVNENIKPIAQLYSKITEVKPIKKGEYVSYNIIFQAPSDGYIAVLPIGYADGIWRSNTGNTVMLEGKKFPIVGRVCMEQCMIFSTISTDFAVDKSVEFFGEHVPISQFAQYNKTIDYEIMCTLSPRIPKYYR